MNIKLKGCSDHGLWYCEDTTKIYEVSMMDGEDYVVDTPIHDFDMGTVKPEDAEEIGNRVVLVADTTSISYIDGIARLVIKYDEAIDEVCRFNVDGVDIELPITQGRGDFQFTSEIVGMHKLVAESVVLNSAAILKIEVK